MIPSSPSFPLHGPHFFRLTPPSSSNSSLTKLISHCNSNSMAACVDTSIIDTSQLSRNPNRSKSDDNSFSYSKFYRPNFPDHVSCIPFSTNPIKSLPSRSITEDLDQATNFEEDPWLRMQEEARFDIEQEPILSSYYYTSVLSRKSLKSALANHLAVKLSNSTLPTATLFDTFIEVFDESEEIINSVKQDLRAVKERDPACLSFVHCFLNFKGFISCQAHRVAHKLWTQGRKALAIVIQNRVSEVFGVDIHPGAKIGHGILLDHATGVVVGETAVIGNNVSILHNVTLGGTGKSCGDRHPKIGDGVLIGAGTCILGNVRIGEGAKIGAGSVVLKDVPARTTAVGNPARLVGGKHNPIKLHNIPSLTMDHTSHIDEWSNYVI